MVGTIIFGVNLLLFAVLAILLFAVTSKTDTKIAQCLRKYEKRISIICGVFFLILFMLDAFGVSGTNGYRYLSVFGEVFTVIVMAYIRFRSRIPKKYQNTIPFAFRAFTVCFLLELFVFNLNSAHLFGKEYTERTLDISSATVENFNTAAGCNLENGESAIVFKGINEPVGTLTIKGGSSNKSSVTFNVSMTDETNSGSYRSNIAAVQVIRDSERSQTIPCNFSGTVYDLKISFRTDENETVTISEILINKPIMLHFSIIRFALIYLGILGIYALCAKELLFRSYSEKRKAVRICAWVFTAVLIAGSLFITNMNRYTNGNHSLAADFTSKRGNQISQEIVDAFENGRLDIDIEMNQELLALDNPYDWSQRNDIGYYPWDHLLYEGKYYSYYGIGPVLVLFLPYHLLTDFYFPSSWAVWLFGILGIFFLTKLYLRFADQFFKNIAASIVFAGLFIMQLSTGIFFCYFHANFYEIAQASGFLCVTSGAFFLFSSNVIGEGKIQNWRLALSAFCLSMGVLCRPTLAVYCIAALLFIYAGFKKKKTLYTKGSKVKYYAPYFCCALFPFAVIGLIQMWYNYARFGSIFDFGIQYSLTINDFISAQYHTHFAVIGFFNYLFTLPSFTENFPFFYTGSPLTFQPQGYYFIATGSALGLLWRALPTLAYGKSLRAYRLSQNKNKSLYALLLFAVCVACPFAIIFSIWESGYGTRYCVDFAWQIILGAMVICAIIYENKQEETKKLLNQLMVFACVFSLIMNFAQIYTYHNPSTLFSLEWQAKTLEFARLFEFWR